MFEVEAKIAISPEQYRALKKELTTHYGKPKVSKKNDFYLVAEKGYFLRVREKNKNSQLDLKIKQVKKGIESNTELTWSIQSAKKLMNNFKKWGIESTFKKVKHGESFQKKSISIELNHIEKLGYFLEIEKLVTQKSQIKKAEKEIESEFNRLGFKKNQFEKRYYYDLLTAR